MRLDNQKQLKIGAVLSYLSVGLNLLAGLVYTPWMLEKLGSSQYGLYTLANSLISVFLLDFGLSAATAKYVSEYHARGEEERVNRFLGTVYKLYLLIDAAIMTVLLVIYFLIDRIYANLTPTELEQFKVVYFIAATFSILNFPFVTLNGVMTAYEKFIQMKLAAVVQKFLQVAIMVAALSAGCGLYTLVAVNAGLGLMVTVYKLVVIRKTTAVKADFAHGEKGIYGELFGFSAWTTVSSVAQRLVFNMVPTVLGMVSDSAQIALFGVVVTIESNVYLLISAIDGMFMPRISKIYAGKASQGETLELLLHTVGKYQFGLGGLIVAGFAVLGREFIGYWVESGYALAYEGILLVVVPGIFYSALQIANTAIVVRKEVKSFALVNLVVGLTSISLSVPLAAKFGAIGACTAICVAYCVRAVLLNLLYSRKLQLNMIHFVKKCYLRMSVPIVLTILLCACVNAHLPEIGWLGLCAKAILVCLVYAGMVLTFGLEQGWHKLLGFCYKKSGK